MKMMYSRIFRSRRIELLIGFLRVHVLKLIKIINLHIYIHLGGSINKY